MPRRLILSGLLFTAAVLLGAFLLTRKTITLQIDGQSRALSTHALTVEGALRQAGVQVLPEDRVEPPLETPLRQGMTVSVERAREVRVDMDGTSRLLRTRLDSPLAILASLGLNLQAPDEVWVDGALYDPARPPVALPQAIEVRRAFTLTVVDGGQAAQVRTAARTAGEALWRAGYRWFAADELAPEAGAPAAAGMTITVRRARPVTILVDGKTLRARTRQTTVGQALAEMDVVLAGLDYAAPAEAEPLPESGLVRVIRVQETFLTAQEALPYETRYQAMPESEIDTLVTLQAGAAGLKQRRVRLRLEDGAEVSRVDEGESILAAPAPRVIGYGTRIVLRTVDTADGALEYWRALTMYATAYSPSRAGVPPTARNYGITASGRPLVKGLVAIDRRLIPFGTRMYVPGYGFAEAADTGGGVKGRWIDLGYDDWNYVSWHQVVTVYFLTPVPPADRIAWIMPATVP